MSNPEDPKQPNEAVEASPEAESTPEGAVERPRFEQIRAILSEMSVEDKARSFEDAIFLLMSSPAQARKDLENVKEDDLTGGREELLRWRKAIDSSNAHYPSVNVSPFEAQDEANWRQAVENEGDEIMAGRPRMSQAMGKVSGESALLRVRAAAGLGTIVNVPLWHTGIWLKIKAPSESTLLELERKMAREKVTLGRLTMGVAFSNVSVYTQSYLTDMILSHVYDGSVKDLSVKNLKERIKITDLPQLVWGMACAIWPNGYRLVRPCVSDPSKCTHVDEAHINISKLSWVNNRMVSKYQRNLMADRDGKFTDEQLVTYRNEHEAPQTRLVKINSGLSLRLEVPSIAEYERCGFRWVDGIVRMTDEAFGQSMRGDDRNTYILQQSAMTNLRRYSHWVKEIVFTDEDGAEESVADDRETIDDALDGLAGNTKISEEVINEIETFMSEAVICAIGIPSYDCPKCKKGPPEEDLPKNLSEIVQLEVNEVFFTLHYMRVINILGAD